jgi:hypothetical protein
MIIERINEESRYLPIAISFSNDVNNKVIEDGFSEIFESNPYINCVGVLNRNENTEVQSGEILKRIQESNFSSRTTFNFSMYITMDESVDLDLYNLFIKTYVSFWNMINGVQSRLSCTIYLVHDNTLPIETKQKLGGLLSDLLESNNNIKNTRGFSKPIIQLVNKPFNLSYANVLDATYRHTHMLCLSDYQFNNNCDTLQLPWIIRFDKEELELLLKERSSIQDRLVKKSIDKIYIDDKLNSLCNCAFGDRISSFLINAIPIEFKKKKLLFLKKIKPQPFSESLVDAILSDLLVIDESYINEEYLQNYFFGDIDYLIDFDNVPLKDFNYDFNYDFLKSDDDKLEKYVKKKIKNYIKSAVSALIEKVDSVVKDMSNAQALNNHSANHILTKQRDIKNTLEKRLIQCNQNIGMIGAENAESFFKNIDSILEDKKPLRYILEQTEVAILVSEKMLNEHWEASYNNIDCVTYKYMPGLGRFEIEALRIDNISQNTDIKNILIGDIQI